MEDMITNFRNLAIVEPPTIEPLDIDEVTVNLLIDLDLNDTADDDMISVPDLVDDLGDLGDCLGDCEDIINNWNCE
jgi:hypothetical protein